MLIDYCGARGTRTLVGRLVGRLTCINGSRTRLRVSEGYLLPTNNSMTEATNTVAIVDLLVGVLGSHPGYWAAQIKPVPAA